MKLKSFGCSFIFGSDLKDSVPGDFSKNIFAVHSKHSWPAVIAKETNRLYECYANPGQGNLAIANSVLTECYNFAPGDFFIISWTYIDRFDYNWLEYAQRWNTIRPGTADAANKFYYKHLHSELKDKLSSLIQIKACLDILLDKKIPFLMANIDPLLFDQTWHTSPSIKMLQELVQPHITSFDNKTFIDYAISLGHVPNDNGHITEHAHYDIAQYVINFLDIQNTGDCLRLS